MAHVHDTGDLTATRRQLGMPSSYASCHTAKITHGAKTYILEGHIPAEDIRRLLDEKPDALGLAVPAMHAGSPGMETPQGQGEAYDTLLVLPDGASRVYARHAP